MNPGRATTDPCCCLPGSQDVRAAPRQPVRGSGHSRDGAASLIPVPGGTCRIGTDDGDAIPGDGEGPARDIALAPFEIGATAVTNAEFAAFVDATGYRTDAERFGWSLVFHLLVPERIAMKRVRKKVAEAPWWWMTEGACWKWPFGRGSHIRELLDHPVTHVSWNDAMAFCAWAGLTLPTEAEWEVAARGGLSGARYPWGNDLTPGGRHMSNLWQGEFPSYNSQEDGFVGTCPVRTFPPNGYGLYEMAGNVWEWCADWFTPDVSLRGGASNPGGPTHGDRKVIRGGSFLCHPSYCNRYRVAARTASTPDSSASNLGFRVARRDPIASSG